MVRATGILKSEEPLAGRDIAGVILQTATASGTRSASAFTFAAGVQWLEAYEAAKQHNRVIVGGFSMRGSVSAAGGWVSGGGHSAMAPNYGLGMSNSPHA